VQDPFLFIIHQIIVLSWSRAASAIKIIINWHICAGPAILKLYTNEPQDLCTIFKIILQRLLHKNKNKQKKQKKELYDCMV
jgi:hypothetical protein